jgi:hypothetical protein
MSLLAAFSSLLAVVTLIVLLMFLHNGYLDISRYFIIATSYIHVVIVVISFFVGLTWLDGINNSEEIKMALYHVKMVECYLSY